MTKGTVHGAVHGPATIHGAVDGLPDHVRRRTCVIIISINQRSQPNISYDSLIQALMDQLNLYNPTLFRIPITSYHAIILHNPTSNTFFVSQRPNKDSQKIIDSRIKMRFIERVQV